MPLRQPRYTKEEAARRGDEIYHRDVRHQVEPQHVGEIVAIDLDTGLWEVDRDERTAAKRLESRRPDAQIWRELGLEWQRFGRALLADGSETVFDIYEVVLIWDGQPRAVSIYEMDAVPLVGMSLMYGYELLLPILDGATFTLRSVASA